MKITFPMNNHVWLFMVGAILIIGASWQPVSRVAVYAYEDASFALRPSAQYAFELGNKHFRANDASSYDITRAKYFYFKAVEIDVDHPMVLQQIARTSFVEGNIDGALAQINLQLTRHPDSNASAYYIRALVLGFMKRYEEAARDYEHFIRLDPTLWPAYNDLAWVHMQSGNLDGAVEAAEQGLVLAPDNAWLLGMKSTALFELGRYEDALRVGKQAVDATDRLTAKQWVVMYPGNDPATIPTGIAALKKANRENLSKFEAKVAEPASAK